MSQNNTNRDIRRFETDADGNTTRVLLNTDEPLGLLDGDYQEQLEELQNRLNAITGGAYSNTVQISHGGTSAENAQNAFDNLISSLNSSLAAMTPSFIVKRNDDGEGAAISVDDAVQALGSLKASNNLSDLQNALTGLQNLYHDVPIAESQGGVPLKDWFDGLYVMLGNNVDIGGDNYYIEPNRYTLENLVYNYLSEYFTKKSNNLSDLQSLVAALRNIFDGVDDISSMLTGGSCILVTNDGIPAPSTAGKATINDLFNVLVGKINTEYGMSKNAVTNIYDFTGNAATATKAGDANAITTGNPISNLGKRYFDVQRKTFSNLSGTATVTFDTLTTNSNVLNYNILSVSVIEVATGRTAIVKDFSVSCESNPSDNNYIYTVSAEIEAQGTGIDVTLEVLYSYQYQQ